ncbi:hypothetical protein MAPG_07873 [Magnaporthiopsis poae ATCC 64411]|uniref:Uncharacterized protein n=1 Tax=Magnaporthiopsis poae (strain ATCC 64411 / 73-15) TaxID=644358 RepID=A0A0C4E5U8_MAGP6|nr:hypothetical protein MAPG_07873 [Magnaporthiopsis poae ATCC 64411]
MCREKSMGRRQFRKNGLTVRSDSVRPASTTTGIQSEGDPTQPTLPPWRLWPARDQWTVTQQEVGAQCFAKSSS